MRTQCSNNGFRICILSNWKRHLTCFHIYTNSFNWTAYYLIGNIQGQFVLFVHQLSFYHTVFLFMLSFIAYRLLLAVHYSMKFSFIYISIIFFSKRIYLFLIWNKGATNYFVLFCVCAFYLNVNYISKNTFSLQTDFLIKTSRNIWTTVQLD